MHDAVCMMHYAVCNSQYEIYNMQYIIHKAKYIMQSTFLLSIIFSISYSIHVIRIMYIYNISYLLCIHNNSIIYLTYIYIYTSTKVFNSCSHGKSGNLLQPVHTNINVNQMAKARAPFLRSLLP